MAQPYQEIMKDLQHSDIHTNLAQTTAPAMPISDEACMLLDKTSVKLAESKDASGVNWCIRKELINALACLDELEKAVTGVHTPTSTTLDKQEDGETLCFKQQEVERYQIDRIRPNPSFQADCSSDCTVKLSPISTSEDKQSEYISDLMERLKTSDRGLLDIQKENDILKQSLEASVLQNEEQKLETQKLNNDLKVAFDEKNDLLKQLARMKNEDLHQSCKDKIAALRSVARALECENELQLEQIKFLESRSTIPDKIGSSLTNVSQDQIKQKDIQIKELTTKFEMKKAENLKLSDQIIRFEKEIETERIFGKNIMTRLSDVQETLDAVRDSKRNVESNLQLIVDQNETLQKQAYEKELDLKSLRETNQSLESQIKDQASTTGALSTATDNLEQEIAMQASFYEDKIESMQREMNDRLEEISVSQEGDAESVRVKYVDLFDEKATELHELRKEYEKQSVKLQEVEQRLADQELIEQENKEKLEKSRQCHNEELSDSLNLAQDEIMALQMGTSEVEKELQSLRHRYDDLQLSYLNAIAHFKSRLNKANQNGDSDESSIQLSSQANLHQEYDEREASQSTISDVGIKEVIYSSEASAEDSPTDDSTSHNISNNSPAETGDDDDSGIKVEMSESKIPAEMVMKDNIIISGTDISMLNQTEPDETSNSLSDTDRTIRELDHNELPSIPKMNPSNIRNNNINKRKARRKRRR